MPGDAKTMSLDYSLLRNKQSTGGVGGEVGVYIEPAYLAFPGINRIAYGYAIDIAILDPPQEQTDSAIPSLLGRDVMDRWRVVYSRSEDLLTAEIRSCDGEFDLGRR